MARGRKPAQAKVAEKLIAALDFVKPATRDVELYQNADHIRFTSGTIIAFNGILSAGHPVEEELEACPHYERLRDALSKAGKTLSITHLETNRLSIKGENLRALVNCVGDDDLAMMNGDFAVAEFDMTPIVDAIKCVGILAKEDAPSVLESSVLLRPNSCAATDRKVMIEAWHGINMPQLVLPKPFVVAVSKCDKKAVKFGFSETSFTIYYEDGSWYKTQLYAEGWPLEAVDAILNVETFPAPVPPTLFDAIQAVASFSESEDVCNFREGSVWSHSNDQTGAQYPVEGLQGDSSYTASYWLKIKHLITSVDYVTFKDKAYFYGDKLRGVIQGRTGE